LIFFLYLTYSLAFWARKEGGMEQEAGCVEGRIGSWRHAKVAKVANTAHNSGDCAARGVKDGEKHGPLLVTKNSG